LILGGSAAVAAPRARATADLTPTTPADGSTFTAATSPPTSALEKRAYGWSKSGSNTCTRSVAKFSGAAKVSVGLPSWIWNTRARAVPPVRVSTHYSPQARRASPHQPLLNHGRWTGGATSQRPHLPGRSVKSSTIGVNLGRRACPGLSRRWLVCLSQHC
jgi:hypothetical protein